ncbi:uncharacterized protein B0T15DRAFT_571417 [Chaetomium strumarium]|uniref:BZIP domain-containing protein n=1 Tax=Chaetomium strumarium TaxID=1170767 RepID=A0AAJ0M6J9_9PEZI|nr:hypothetical protein B0T15DRAFT_571417 [Chaetomium strumarium]
MSLAHTQLPGPYQDALPADPRDWVVDDAVLSTVPSSTGFPPPVEETFYGWTSNFADANVLLASLSQSTGEYHFCGEDGQLVMPVPMGSVYGSGETQTINLAAPAVATAMQDPPWNPVPCESHHHLACSVLSTAQGPVIMDPASEAAPITEQHSPPSEWRGQLQHTITSSLPPRDDPIWKNLKKQRLRAGRRRTETRNRNRNREKEERIKSTSEQLERKRADLVAQEKALKEERLILIEELLAHAHCNDSAISEYLAMASKDV